MLHRASGKSGDKGGKYGLNIIYALNYSTAFIARIFAFNSLLLDNIL